MADLLAKGDKQPQIPKIGELVKGKIIDIGKATLHLDLPNYGSGIIIGKELIDDQDTFLKVQIGDEVLGTVMDPENEDGQVELSLRLASKESSWNELKEKQAKAKVIPVSILDANKGGLIVQLQGITGFLPVSQLTSEHYPRVSDANKQEILEKLQSYVGQTFRVKILDLDPEEEKLIVSEKEAFLSENQEEIGSLKVGDKVEGVVSGVTDFGAFIKFGKLEGLVHISELAWQRIDDPRQYISVGQKVKAAVIGIEGARISLSIKKLLDDPWEGVKDKYSVGQVVKGTVIKIEDFGVFVKLDDDIHGLAHISELSGKTIQHPSETVKIGQSYPFKITNLEPSEHRLGLSLKTTEEKTTPEAPEEKKKEKKKVKDK